MGGEALIYALCRFLMCRQPEGHKSCGHCHSCQLMQAGTHPDYYALSPEKGKSALGIDAVRDVNEKLYEHARLGGAKVVWISDAALLTDAAANALLKTLEEPPENTWFFLACRSRRVCWPRCAAAVACITLRRRQSLRSGVAGA
jgi:DNA polymerase-3 subunit delta'